MKKENNKWIVAKNHGTFGKRLEWIDALRALAMFFVVLHHASVDLSGHWLFNVFISPVMIPLFFAISGYVFNDRKGKQLDFFWNLFKSLVVPWVFFSAIKLQAYLIPFGSGPKVSDLVLSFISGGVLWFFPALIFAQIFLFYLCKFIKDPVFVCIAMAAVSLLGVFMADIEFGGFAMFNRGMIAQAFMLIGYLFRICQNKFSRLSWWKIIVGLLAYSAFGIVMIRVYPNQFIDVHMHIYPNIALGFLMIYFGCFLFFIFASKIRKVPKFIGFVGKNTLVCYALHMYSIIGLRHIFSMMFDGFASNWIFEVFNSLVSVAVCAFVSLVLNFLVPELVGKRRKRKQK